MDDTGQINVEDVKQLRKYVAWIKDWLSKNDPLAQCAKATTEMQEEFPELIRVRGHYIDVAWGDREHWWLKTPLGVIVDPTCSQFPTKGKSTYEELDESKEYPVGKCMNCGDYCFRSNGGGQYHCSEKCLKILISDDS